MGDRVEVKTLESTEREGIAASRTDRRRSLDALHELESSAAGAAPGRETDWTQGVRDALGALEAALLQQARHSGESESPLSDIEFQEPRLRNRVVQLRQRYAELERRVAELRSQLDSTAARTGDIADIRRQLEDVASEVRYLQAREADLVYEAYAVDLGAGD